MLRNEEEETRVRENLAVIRSYLKNKFRDFEITEDLPLPGMFHMFTVTNQASQKTFRLQVGWPRLSDKINTPEKTKFALERESVAEKMCEPDSELYW